MKMTIDEIETEFSSLSLQLEWQSRFIPRSDDLLGWELWDGGTRQRRQLAPPSQPSQPPASQTARPDQWRQSCRAGREAERVSCSAGEPQLRSRLARPGKWRGGSFKLTNWREILSMIWGLFLGRCWNAVPSSKNPYFAILPYYLRNKKFIRKFQ